MAEQYPRIYLSRSVKEWAFVEKRLRDMGIKNLSSHLQKEIPLLKKDFDNCPERFCLMSGQRRQIQQYIPSCVYEILNEISEQSNVEKGMIVNRLIIEPLLILP